MEFILGLICGGFIVWFICYLHYMKRLTNTFHYKIGSKSLTRKQAAEEYSKFVNATKGLVDKEGI